MRLYFSAFIFMHCTDHPPSCSSFQHLHFSSIMPSLQSKESMPCTKTLHVCGILSVAKLFVRFVIKFSSLQKFVEQV